MMGLLEQMISKQELHTSHLLVLMTLPISWKIMKKQQDISQKIVMVSKISFLT